MFLRGAPPRRHAVGAIGGATRSERRSLSRPDRGLPRPCTGTAKDELASEDVRQHRRTLRHAWATGIALFAVTLAAIAMSVFAVNAAAAHRAAARRTPQGRATAGGPTGDIGVGSESAQRAAGTGRGTSEGGRPPTGVGVASSDRGAARPRRKPRQRTLAEAAPRATSRPPARASTPRTRVSTRPTRSTTPPTRISATDATLVAQQQATEQQRLAGVAHTLALGSQTSLADGATDRALVLAAQATRLGPRSGGLIGAAELRAPLVNALQRNPRQVALRGLDGPIADVTVAPDGSRAAAVSQDGRTAVWNLADRRLLAVFKVPDFTIWVRFLDAGTIITAGSRHIDTYHATSDGAVWTPLWTRSTGLDTITAIATTPTTRPRCGQHLRRSCEEPCRPERCEPVRGSARPSSPTRSNALHSRRRARPTPPPGSSSIP